MGEELFPSTPEKLNGIGGDSVAAFPFVTAADRIAAVADVTRVTCPAATRTVRHQSTLIVGGDSTV